MRCQLQVTNNHMFGLAGAVPFMLASVKGPAPLASVRGLFALRIVIVVLRIAVLAARGVR